MAHAFTVGFYGLVGATFLPMVLRVAHSIEIAGDSFAYAGLLVLLFAAPSKIANSTTATIKAATLQPTLFASLQRRKETAHFESEHRNSRANKKGRPS